MMPSVLVVLVSALLLIASRSKKARIIVKYSLHLVLRPASVKGVEVAKHRVVAKPKGAIYVKTESVTALMVAKPRLSGKPLVAKPSGDCIQLLKKGI